VLVAVLAVAGLIAVYRLPVSGLVVLCIAALGPTVLQNSGVTPLSIAVPGVRMSVADVIMVAMLVAVVVRLAVAVGASKGRHSPAIALLTVAYCALLAWLAFSMARNLGQYGIHAPGHFRYSYLLLVTPAYAALFLQHETQRRRFIAILLALTVAGVLAAVPVVGHFKGWAIGPGSRFFPAAVSLSLLFGWTALLVFTERGLLPIPKWLPRALGIPVAALLIVDSHRSVWLAGAVMAGYALLSGRTSAPVVVRLLALGAAAFTTALVVSYLWGFNLVDYVVTRGDAFLNPSADNTSTWRIGLWTSSLRQWLLNPWAGEGFGGYYSAHAARGVSEAIQPHSAYVQSLVTLGVIGLGLLLLTGIGAWFAIRRAVRDGRDAVDLGFDVTAAEVGLLVLAGSAAFCLVYPIPQIACLYVGVALAAALAILQRHGSADSDWVAESHPVRRHAREDS
jgi:O-antigen ligase